MQGESFKTWLFRKGINLYPMYFGTGGKVLFLRADWQHVTVGLKLNLWTRNYVGTIFGGSLFSALDPFPMVLLLNCLGKKDYVVWDKAGSVDFKKPGRGRLKADVSYTDAELENIKAEVGRHGKYVFVKSMSWLDQDGDVVANVDKTVYVATKEYYRKRQKEKGAQQGSRS